MSLHYPSRTEKIPNKAPLLPLLFIGLSVMAFSLLVILAFAPEKIFYSIAESPWISGVFILCVSIGGSYYHFYHQKFRLPLILLALLPLLLASPLLWPVATGLMSIKEVIKLQSHYLMMIVTGWLLSFLLVRPLYKIALIPKTEEHKWANRRLWDERGVFVDIGSWNDQWKSWQARLTILTAVGALLVNHCSLTINPLHFSFIQLLFALQIILNIILLIQGHFYYRRALWQVEGLTPEPAMEGLWRRWSSGVVIGVFLLSLLLPGDLRGIKDWWLVRAIGGLLLFFKRDLSFSEESAPPITGPMGFDLPATAAEHSIWHLIVFLIMQAFFLLIALLSIFGLLFLIGYLLNKFMGSETQRLKGLPGLILRFYRYWRAFFRRLRSKKRRFKTKYGVDSYGNLEAGGSLSTKGRTGFYWGNTIRAAVRRGYYRLIRRGRMDGLNWRPSQTPEEIAHSFTELLPTEEGLLTEITTDYHQARYAPKEPGNKMVQEFLRRVRMIIRKLRGHFD